MSSNCIFNRVITVISLAFKHVKKIDTSLARKLCSLSVPSRLFCSFKNMENQSIIPELNSPFYQKLGNQLIHGGSSNQNVSNIHQIIFGPRNINDHFKLIFKYTKNKDFRSSSNGVCIGKGYNCILRLRGQVRVIKIQQIALRALLC